MNKIIKLKGIQIRQWMRMKHMRHGLLYSKDLDIILHNDSTTHGILRTKLVSTNIFLKMAVTYKIRAAEEIDEVKGLGIPTLPTAKMIFPKF